MKKKLRNFLASALALAGAGTLQPVQATHVMGTEINYICLAPGVYNVKLKLYRDCNGIAARSSALLDVKSMGCNPGRTVALAKVGNGTIGNPYCPQIPVTCSSNSPYPNYEEIIYDGTVTFSAAEQACPDWKLSWSECCRANTANTFGQPELFAEAYLNLGSASNPIVNSSPEFGSLVVPFVNAYQPITISSYAMDAEGDSLVYSLATPLQRANSPVSYQNYQALVINDPDTNSTKIAAAPAGTYSATFPMHSFKVDWTQANPVAIPYFDLDPQSGSLSFTPTAYFPNSSPVQGLNKYVMVVNVDEYRNINGQPVKIGSIRRDMMITVMDCGPNQNPAIIAPVANGQPIAPEDVINLRPGTPLTLTFEAADNNSNDILTMESDAEQMLSGASFIVTNGNNPTGTLTWTPTAADVSNNIYYFRVTVKDNACPVRGVHVRTFAVKVSNTGGVTGTKADLQLNKNFTAFPNPFTEQINFKFSQESKAETIIIYNLIGRQIDEIQLKTVGSGEQKVQWQNANKHAAGTYIAKLVSKDKTIQTLKFTKVQ